MNNTACSSGSQVLEEEIIYNNGEEKTCVSKSQRSLQCKTNAITLTADHVSQRSEVSLGNERDSEAAGARIAALPRCEEMGVVNKQQTTLAGPGKRDSDSQEGHIDRSMVSVEENSNRRTGDASKHRSVSGSATGTDAIKCVTKSDINHQDVHESNDGELASCNSDGLTSDTASARTSKVIGCGHHSFIPADHDGNETSPTVHSRGIKTEVIINKQTNGDINRPSFIEFDMSSTCHIPNKSTCTESVSHVHLEDNGVSHNDEFKAQSNDSGNVQLHNSNMSTISEGAAIIQDKMECEEKSSNSSTGNESPHQIHVPRVPSLGNNSPATIDVTSSEEWDDAQSELLRRPQFFPENLTDLTPSPNSQHSSQSTSSWSSQSQQTLSFSSTPIDKSGNNSGSLQEGISDVDTQPSGKGPLPSAFAMSGDSGNTPTRSRTSTASLSTDFSSNVSIATDELNEAIADGLVLGEEDQGFEEVNLELGEQGHPPGASVIDSGAKPKKKGLGGFLTRNIFRRSLGKSSPVSPSADPSSPSPSPPGWKLFGRVPARESASGVPRGHLQISEDFQKRGQTHPPTSSLTWKKRHTGMKEASSTTALILENRPINLPAKNPEEEEKHKEEYIKMLKEAKKKELKLYKQKLKKLAQQLKVEDGVKTSLHVWQQEILPKWDEVKKHKKTRDLWWQGIPPSLRGRVWMLAIKNELNITHELFEIFLSRAKDKIRMCSESESEGIGLEEIHAASRENSVDVIKLDVARTFPHLCIFQKGGPYFDLLHSVLGAYACYRPDVGYVQGMSFIAAVFLLYLDVADAFICFANLLNKSCQLAFFRLDQPVMQSYFSVFEEYFQDHLPKLFAHFDELGISPDLFIIDWMYTLYSKSLPLDVACRVWDVFFRDGEELLFRTALGILSLYEDVLLNMDFIQAAQFLTNIPVGIDSDQLFKHIDTIDMHQKKFGQVLMQHMSAILGTGSQPGS